MLRSSPSSPPLRAGFCLVAIVTLLVLPAAGQTGRHEMRLEAAGAEDYRAACRRIDSWREHYPELVRRIVIGRSVEGRALTVLRISATPETGVPEVYLGGAIHGVECSERDVLWMVDSLLERAHEPAIAELLRARILWVQPMVSPDGVFHRTRRNARGVDLNRNFSRLWSPFAPPGHRKYPGPVAFSEPETCAVRDFLRGRKNLRGYLDLHRSTAAVIVPEVSSAGVIAPACRRLWREMNEAMGGHDRLGSPLRYPGDGGFSIDWVWSSLGVMAFTWELLHDAEPAFDDDARWKGLLYLLENCAQFPAIV